MAVSAMWVFGAGVLAVAAVAAAPAEAGMTRLKPGQTDAVDVSTTGDGTSAEITNRGNETGRIELGGVRIEIPPNGRVSIDSLPGRGTVPVSNTGTTEIWVLTRYMERPRLP